MWRYFVALLAAFVFVASAAAQVYPPVLEGMPYTNPDPAAVTARLYAVEFAPWSIPVDGDLAYAGTVAGLAGGAGLEVELVCLMNARGLCVAPAPPAYRAGRAFAWNAAMSAYAELGEFQPDNLLPFEAWVFDGSGFVWFEGCLEWYAPPDTWQISNRCILLEFAVGFAARLPVNAHMPLEVE